MPIKIKRTNGLDPDFCALVKELDLYLKFIDGDQNEFYSKYNKIDDISFAIVLYLNGIPIGCGAIKAYKKDTMEIKRMFVIPVYRRKGFANMLLMALEKWSLEMNKPNCILETGKRMPDAVAFYKNLGYQQTNNYGQYIGVSNSICFEKKLN